MSCSNSNTQKENPLESLKDIEYKKGLKHITDKNNVFLSLKKDLLLSRLSEYTYEIEDKIMNNHRPILFEGFIRDIKRSGSAYLLIVEMKNRHHYYLAEVIVNPDQLRDIREKVRHNILLKRGGFIFIPESFSSIDTRLVAEGDNSEEFEIAYNMTSNLIIIKGKMMDYCIE